SDGNPVELFSVNGPTAEDQGRLFTTDLNGDGTTDLLYYDPVSFSWQAFLGTGTGMEQVSLPDLTVTGPGGSTRIYVADITGNGLGDIIEAGKGDNGVSLRLHRNEGLSFDVGPTREVPAGTDDFDLVFSDFTGNGKREGLLFGESEPWLVSFEVGSELLLTGAIDGKGLPVFFAYKTYQYRSPFYPRTSEREGHVSRSSRTGYLCSSLKVGDPSGDGRPLSDIFYHYGSVHYDPVDRSPMGFKKVTVLDHTNGLRKELTFGFSHNNENSTTTFSYPALLKSLVYYDQDARPVSVVSHVHTARDVGGGRFFPYTVNSVETRLLKGSNPGGSALMARTQLTDYVYNR
ncbi:MAG: VCBS repeat-containing protein, partial [Firmicutes bacterium]|nr:VCBS repeat-containing protein [Bacillota bacterium]